MHTPVRALAAHDAASVAALIRQCFAGLDIHPRPSALRETEASVTAHLAAGGGAAVEAEGRIVASVLWTEKEGGLYIGRLSVASAWRRQGLARLLMAQAEAEARARGMPRIHLGARLALPGNRALFASLGFVDGPLHTHDGCTAPTWVEMEKHLA